jgi:hypothetical protein
MNIRASIIEKSDEIKELLLKKNSAYGNSALQPGGIFSHLDRIEALKARIDDKLNRIKNVGVHGETEDTVMDLAGYLILLMIALDNEGNNIPEYKGYEESTSHNDTNSASTHTTGEVGVSYRED